MPTSAGIFLTLFVFVENWPSSVLTGSKSRPIRTTSLRMRNYPRAVRPVKIAAGEHIANRVLFKNFLEVQALSFIQVDCTRVAGISEFLTVSLHGQDLRSARGAARRRHGATASALGSLQPYWAWAEVRVP